MDNKNKKHKYWWAIGYGIVLTVYGIFTLLYTFVIPRDIVYISDTTTAQVESETTTESSGHSGRGHFGHRGRQSSSEDETVTVDSETNNSSEDSNATYTDTSYESDDISINITTEREYDTDIYIADVTIKDVSLLKAGLADNAFGRNLTANTSDIAESCNAIFAINGDYYGFKDDGYVLRNGYLYRETARSEDDDDALVVYADGSLDIVNENDISASDLVDEGAQQIFCFGPGLLEDGQILVDADTEVGRHLASNPRTAIGMISPLHYIFVVSDGRTSESEGLSLVELAQFMKDQGCTLAYNMDGGGSSTMWFMGNIINNPTDGTKTGEREVSDIVYIGE